MNPDSKIYLAGHTGLVGSALLRRLTLEGYTNIITRRSSLLDLTCQQQAEDFFKSERPEYVFVCSAKVGGVQANNSYRATFIRDNLAIQTNVIHSAYLSGVKKLMFMGSNCIYPKLVNQPIKEDYLLAGKLEPTTESYAIAKICGIKMCEAYRDQYGCNFISVLPVNLYGPNDNYDLESSHVMPALLSKFHSAVKNNLPSVEVWGSGRARREFMHVDDLSSACLFLMLHYNDVQPINIGTGADIPIHELAELIKEISGYKGNIVFNSSRPDGAISKLLDTSKINALGWKPSIGLREGIAKTYSEKFGSE